MSVRPREASGSDENAAYERAVLAARADATMRREVETAFLQEDAGEALAAFCASEHWARIRRLLTDMGVPRGASVMDFGGGRGLVAAALALDGYAATLCEINPSAVCGTRAAEAMIADAGADVRIVTGSVDALDARDRFDAVVCRAVLHHVSPLVPTLAAIRRVLEPGGAFIASDEPTVRRMRDVARFRAAHPFTRFGVSERALLEDYYVRALEAAGFVDVSSHFPVAFSDYRSAFHPRAPRWAARALYARYRVRSALFYVPGQVRSFTARAER